MTFIRFIISFSLLIIFIKSFIELTSHMKKRSINQYSNFKQLTSKAHHGKVIDLVELDEALSYE